MVKEITMLDLCAGGFGGWSTAMENLACDFEVPMKKNIVIDDHSAMQYWALNHSASHFETQALHKLPGNIAIVGDLQSNHWRQAVFHQRPQVTTISAPCISRSGAGKEQGFHAEGGIVLLTVLGLVRFSRPWARVVLFPPTFSHVPWFNWLYIGRLSHGIPQMPRCQRSCANGQTKMDRNSYGCTITWQFWHGYVYSYMVGLTNVPPQIIRRLWLELARSSETNGKSPIQCVAEILR